MQFKPITGYLSNLQLVPGDNLPRQSVRLTTQEGGIVCWIEWICFKCRIAQSRTNVLLPRILIRFRSKLSKRPGIIFRIVQQCVQSINPRIGAKARAKVSCYCCRRIAPHPFECLGRRLRPGARNRRLESYQSDSPKYLFHHALAFTMRLSRRNGRPELYFTSARPSVISIFVPHGSLMKAIAMPSCGTFV
jgi:hypothetical protein